MNAKLYNYIIPAKIYMISYDESVKKEKAHKGLF